MNMQATDWETIFINSFHDRGLVSRIYKNFLKPQIKEIKRKTPSRGGNDFKSYFTNMMYKWEKVYNMVIHQENAK